MPLAYVDLNSMIEPRQVVYYPYLCVQQLVTALLLKLTWHVAQEDELKDAPVKHGGVLTPASAMGMLLVRRLQDSGVSFTVQ